MTKTDAWMPLWIGAYHADTQRLTRDQHGGYLLLIMDYWRNGPPPDDDEVLRTIVKATPAEWRKLRPVLSGFFRVTDGKWLHKRIEHELEQAGNRKAAKHQKAAAGGSTRWDSGRESAAERGRHLRAQRLAEARKKGTHTDDQWALMKSIHGFLCVRCGASGELVKDHITPIYQGGSDGIENIQPMCRSCNASKGPEAVDHRKADWRNAFDEGNTEGNTVGIQEGIERLPGACPTPTPSPTPTASSLRSDAQSVGADAREQAPTLAGEACRLMRECGAQRVNPSDPRLLQLLSQGVTPRQLGDLAGELREARGAPQNMALVVATMSGRLRDAAAMPQHPDGTAQRAAGARSKQRETTEEHNRRAIAQFLGDPIDDGRTIDA